MASQRDARVHPEAARRAQQARQRARKEELQAKRSAARALAEELPPAERTLGELRTLRAFQVQTVDRIAVGVSEARRYRCSWVEIGAALGVSAQAVQQRFG